MLKSAVAVLGILPKGITKLKKRVLEDNVTNITRSGKHYKPSFLEKDHPGRNMVLMAILEVQVERRSPATRTKKNW